MYDFVVFVEVYPIVVEPFVFFDVFKCFCTGLLFELIFSVLYNVCLSWFFGSLLLAVVALKKWWSLDEDLRWFLFSRGDSNWLRDEFLLRLLPLPLAVILAFYVSAGEEVESLSLWL